MKIINLITKLNSVCEFIYFKKNLSQLYSLANLEI